MGDSDKYKTTCLTLSRHLLRSLFHQCLWMVYTFEITHERDDHNHQWNAYFQTGCCSVIAQPAPHVEGKYDKRIIAAKEICSFDRCPWSRYNLGSWSTDSRHQHVDTWRRTRVYSCSKLSVYILAMFSRGVCWFSNLQADPFVKLDGVFGEKNHRQPISGTRFVLN